MPLHFISIIHILNTAIQIQNVEVPDKNNFFYQYQTLFLFLIFGVVVGVLAYFFIKNKKSILASPSDNPDIKDSTNKTKSDKIEK